MLAIDSPALSAPNDSYPVDASRCSLDPDSLRIDRAGYFQRCFLERLRSAVLEVNYEQASAGIGSSFGFKLERDRQSRTQVRRCRSWGGNVQPRRSVHSGVLRSYSVRCIRRVPSQQLVSSVNVDLMFALDSTIRVRD